VNLLLRWLAAAAAVWVATKLVPGIRYEGGFQTLLVVALILGLVNALVRPLLKFLACGIIALTLGLFLLVINAGMLGLVAAMLDGFAIERFSTRVACARMSPASRT